MTVQLRPEDFNDFDWDDVEVAAGEVMAVITDISHHNIAEGDGWSPWAHYPDTPALIAEARGHLDRLDEAIKSARRQIATVERPARLRAVRREKAGS